MNFTIICFQPFKQKKTDVFGILATNNNNYHPGHSFSFHLQNTSTTLICLYLSVVKETDKLWVTAWICSADQEAALESHHCSYTSRHSVFLFLSSFDANTPSPPHPTFTPLLHSLSCLPLVFSFSRPSLTLQPDLYLDFLVWSCHNTPRCQHL